MMKIAFCIIGLVEFAAMVIIVQYAIVSDYPVLAP